MSTDEPAERPDGDRPGPPDATPRPYESAKPRSWLAFSIAATVFCCLPAGAVGIAYAVRVDRLWAQGRYAEAEDAATNAQIWTVVAALFGAITLLALSALVLGGPNG